MGVKIVMKLLTVKEKMGIIILSICLGLGGFVTSATAALIGFNLEGEFDREPANTTISGMFTFDTDLNQITSYMFTTTNTFFEDFSNEPFPSPLQYSLPGSDFTIQNNNVDGLIVDQQQPPFGVTTAGFSRLGILVIDNTLPNTTRATIFEEYFVTVNGQELSLSQRGTATISRKDMNPVPVPGTVVLMSTGLLGLAGYRWKQRRSEQS